MLLPLAQMTVPLLEHSIHNKEVKGTVHPRNFLKTLYTVLSDHSCQTPKRTKKHHKSIMKVVHAFPYENLFKALHEEKQSKI